jgi:hypothetical protein
VAKRPSINRSPMRRLFASEVDELARGQVDGDEVVRRFRAGAVACGMIFDAQLDGRNQHAQIAEVLVVVIFQYHLVGALWDFKRLRRS